MSTIQPTTEQGLETLIDETIADIQRHEVGSMEYEVAVDTLVKLYELKAKDKPQRISPDTLATVAANLLGIAIIVVFEQNHIMTSKSLNFIRKLW